MELVNLAAFVAVAEHGGFSAACDSLHLTQPAISKRIAQLEAAVDARLFDRVGRQTVLTEAGVLLLPRARQLLADADAAKQALHALGHGVSGPLRMASSHHIGLHRLPPLLRRFTALYPDVTLDIRFLDSEQAWQEVLQGKIELALTTLGQAAHPLSTTPIWEDKLCFVAAPEHPLAQRKRLSLEDLARHPAVLPDLDTFTHRIVADAFVRHGLQLRLRMTTHYLETLKMLSAVGLAWSVLPHTMVDQQLRVLPVSGISLSRRLGAVTHAGRSLPRAGQAFLALLEAERV